jgi:hypothetical protein
MPKIPLGQLWTIAFTIALLVAVIVLKGQCGAAVGNMFQVIDANSDGGLTKPDTPRNQNYPHGR